MIFQPDIETRKSEQEKTLVRPNTLKSQSDHGLKTPEEGKQANLQEET